MGRKEAEDIATEPGATPSAFELDLDEAALTRKLLWKLDIRYVSLV